MLHTIFLIITKLLWVVLAFGLGYGCNEMYTYVNVEYLTKSKPIPDSDVLLRKLEQRCFSRGSETDFYALKTYYMVAYDYTEWEALLDYMIMANRHLPNYVSAEIYKILSSLIVKDEIRNVDDWNMSYCLEEMARGYLLRGALKHDYNAYQGIRDCIHYRNDFYDERLDSLAREYDAYVLQTLSDSAGVALEKVQGTSRVVDSVKEKLNIRWE